MQSIELRWNELQPSLLKPIFQLVDANHPLRFYLGKSISNECLCLLIDETKPVFIKSLKAIDIDISERPDGTWSLLMTLKDIDFLGLFSQLCEDLLYSSKSLPKSASASAFVSRRLLSWKRMMEEGNKQTLGISEIRGLIGELWTLEQKIIPKYGNFASIKAWVGPLGANQDFQFEDTAFEVKTVQLGCDFIQVSNENQLDNSDREIQLEVHELTESFHNDAFSLNAIVDRVQSLLDQDFNALDAFDERLCAVGYARSKDYDDLKFKIVSTQRYLISHDFPRVTAGQLMQGISDVKYKIFLSNCSKFKII
ncbi:MAG: hypothetical protein RL462_802 [Pseudomonadota bacterium]|jgi:hypothetical protein